LWPFGGLRGRNGTRFCARGCPEAPQGARASLMSGGHSASSRSHDAPIAINLTLCAFASLRRLVRGGRRGPSSTRSLARGFPEAPQGARACLMLGGHPASSRSHGAPIAINLCELKIGIFNRIYLVGLWQRAPTAGTRVRLKGTALDRYDPRRTLGDTTPSDFFRRGIGGRARLPFFSPDR
jgi:hypothetical protein